MLPNSKITSSLAMVRKKPISIVSLGLAPFFKSLLLDSLEAPNIESLNDVTQTCEMDLYICYCDVIDNQILGINLFRPQRASRHFE